MTQPTFAHDDLFEGALLRLLDPSRMPGARDGLSGAAGRRRRRARGIRGDGAGDAAAPVAARIRIVEILSATSVSVRWSDPLFGHFGEQIWHCVTARTASRCVLTGAPINRGDRVYRPRGRGRTVPCNWDRMIHAAAVAPARSRDADDA
ncbi:hypothetical protein WI41_16225 [Burkholderia latens]|uniref:DUF3331 domain-containing protein n=1 Tax=Burkholderia latens TaxID=488446 RepID=A0AAP1GAJ6_9BURK|nr:DUF3331 domain-containing protein [Burkholderia latens]KVA06726.1 hypothetical protein WI41_16225 [Burkholderia latens]MBY4693241.1 DUF3331 domain-containing protein [Burkholderia latens]QTO51999.1 DUF3331 domain-containing protein [Burkholderia latens]